MNIDIEFDYFGLSTDHEIDYIIDYPDGIPYYFISCFLTPFQTITKNGKETGSPGQFIINTPGFPHWHRGLPGKSFCNHWCRIAGKTVEELFEFYSLPCNELLDLKSTDFFPEALIKIQEELYGKNIYYKEAIYHRMSELFISLSRNIKRDEEESLYTKSEAVHFEKMQEVRMEVHRRFKSQWNIKKMADKAHISPSRFSVLYTRFFEVSPMDDLIDQRLNYAKMLLTDSSMTVSDIAVECGFSSVYYFSRIFKKRVGCPPAKFGRTKA